MRKSTKDGVPRRRPASSRKTGTRGERIMSCAPLLCRRGRVLAPVVFAAPPRCYDRQARVGCYDTRTQGRSEAARRPSRAQRAAHAREERRRGEASGLCAGSCALTVLRNCMRADPAAAPPALLRLLLLLAALDAALCLALGVSWQTSAPLVLRPGAAGAAVASMSAAPVSPVVVAGFESLADRYDGFILDQFGVMHNGVVALPGAQECFEKLAKAGKKLVILSNTSRRAVSASRPSRAGSRRFWNRLCS